MNKDPLLTRMCQAVSAPLVLLSHLISPTTLWGRYNYPYFTEEETKAQALSFFKVKCPKQKYMNKHRRDIKEYSTEWASRSALHRSLTHWEVTNNLCPLLSRQGFIFFFGVHNWTVASPTDPLKHSHARGQAAI